jgi:hypothetical protein
LRIVHHGQMVSFMRLLVASLIGSLLGSLVTVALMFLLSR